MSFDLMRRHRRKVEVPLAIFVVITFVLFFGISGVDKVYQEWRMTRARSRSGLDDKLLALGRDLASAMLMGEPQIDNKARDHDEQLRAAYIRAAWQNHYLPAKLAEELGIQVSREELSQEITRRLQGHPWYLSPPISEEKYVKVLANRGLTYPRYEELLRDELASQRMMFILTSAGGSSEAEQYGLYASVRTQVRVQYFQRRREDFLKEVEEASKQEAAGEPAEKRPEKAAGTAPAKEPEKDKPKRKGVSDQDVRKRYDADIDRIKKRGKPAAGTWDSRDARKNPEYFSDERAQIEYLVALRSSFAKGLTVTADEIKKHYDDNPTKYLEEPKPAEPPKEPKAGEAPKPQRRPLDDKLRAEIEKELLERKALDAAEKALADAIGEYNKAESEKRPALGDLAGKYRLEPPGLTGPAKREDLEALKYFEAEPAILAQAFSERARTRAEGKFFLPERTKENSKDKEDNAVIALRVAKFEARSLLGFDQVKATVRERLVLEKALELAKAAVEADRKLLVDGKLDPKLVRTSIPLGPDDEVCEVLLEGRLAIGEASAPYPYTELLGEEAAAEKEREKQKEKAGKKKEKPAVGDSYAKGWRVVILDERKAPTLDDFRKDSAWKSRWAPEASPWLPPEYAEYAREMQRRSPDNQWREFYINGWAGETARKIAGSAE